MVKPNRFHYFPLKFCICCFLFWQILRMFLKTVINTLNQSIIIVQMCVESAIKDCSPVTSHHLIFLGSQISQQPPTKHFQFRKISSIIIICCNQTHINNQTTDKLECQMTSQPEMIEISGHHVCGGVLYIVTGTYG